MLSQIYFPFKNLTPSPLIMIQWYCPISACYYKNDLQGGHFCEIMTFGVFKFTLCNHSNERVMQQN